MLKTSRGFVFIKPRVRDGEWDGEGRKEEVGCVNMHRKWDEVKWRWNEGEMNGHGLRKIPVYRLRTKVIEARKTNQTLQRSQGNEWMNDKCGTWKGIATWIMSERDEIRRTEPKVRTTARACFWWSGSWRANETQMQGQVKWHNDWLKGTSFELVWHVFKAYSLIPMSDTEPGLKLMIGRELLSVKKWAQIGAPFRLPSVSICGTLPMAGMGLPCAPANGGQCSVFYWLGQKHGQSKVKRPEEGYFRNPAFHFTSSHEM